MTKIKAEQKLYSFIFWRDSTVFALRWVCFVLTFFMIEGVWATSTLSIRANQLGDQVMKALSPETGLVATPNISIFKTYFIDFADHYDERGENSVFAVDSDMKNNNDGAISDSFDMDKLENEDIPRMHGIGYLKLLTNFYLTDVIQTTIILEEGIYNRPESRVLPPERLFINEAVLQILKENRKKSLEALHFIKDQFKDFYIDTLKDASFPNYIISSEESVNSVHDYVIYSYDVMKTTDCIESQLRGLEILQIFDLLPNDTPLCPTEAPTDPNRLNCFEAHDEFLEYLKKTQMRQVYIFIEGGKYLIPLGRERGAPKYCQFLGGRWSLDPSNPLKLNPKSKVEIMTPSGIRESIDSEQLTRMRLELLKR